MSQALDLVFSQSSLYLVWSDKFKIKNENLWACEGARMRTCIVKVYVDLRHCTRQHWLWHFGFGAGPWIACTDVWSFHSLLCNSAKRHIQTLQSARCSYSEQLRKLVWSLPVLAVYLPCWQAERFSSLKQSQGCLSLDCSSPGQCVACSSSTVIQQTSFTINKCISTWEKLYILT